MVTMKVLYTLEWIPEKYKKLKEKDITSWFWQQVRKHFWFFHKISDQSSDLKPCDCIVWVEFDWFKISWLIEFKISKNKKKMNVDSLLRPNQRQWLKLRKDNNWQALVWLYSTEKNIIYIFDIDDVIKYKEFCL